MEVNAHAGPDGATEGQLAQQQDLNVAEGQPASETQVEGQPEGVQDSSTTETTPLSFEQLQKDNKELQTEFGKRNEAYKELEGKLTGLDQYGGVDQMSQWAAYLNDNPRFAEWVQQEQARDRDNHLGIDENLDEDTRKALEMVDKRAEHIADQRIKEAMKNQVDPLVAANKERSLQMNIDKMDETYGDEWREVQDVMSELASSLSPEVQDNPTYETLDDLYWKALRTSGKMESYAAKSYEKRLQARKETSTEKPFPAGKGSSKKAMTMTEAFNMAKEAQT